MIIITDKKKTIALNCIVNCVVMFPIYVKGVEKVWKRWEKIKINSMEVKLTMREFTFHSVERANDLEDNASI